MDTREYVELFYQDCRQRGLSPGTIRKYDSVLRHFVAEYPELPTSTHKIDNFLKARGETPKKRGPRFHALQAFYTYLERAGHIKESPVPPKGKVGRPAKPVPSFAQLMHTTDAMQSKLHLGGGSLSSSSSTSISTAAAIDAFVKSRDNVSIHQKRRYHWVFSRFNKQFPDLPLTPEPLEEYLHQVKGEPESRFAHHATIHALYKFLDERYLLFDRELRNPFSMMRAPSLPRKVRGTIELLDLGKLLQLDLTPQHKAIIWLLIDTGMRRGELVSLDRENVHEGYVIVAGKTGQHSIPISEATYQLLIQLADSGPLFINPGGERMKAHSIYFIVRDALARIGYTHGKRGPHILRHSFGRHHMAEGGDLESLKGILGHTRIQMTSKYAELAFTDIKKRHREVGLLAKLTNGGTNNG